MRTTTIVLAILFAITFVFAWIGRGGEADAGPERIGPRVFGPQVGEDYGEIADVARRARGLHMTTWSGARQEAENLKIVFEDGRWIIPSHYDYPADGGEKVGEVAGRMLGIEKGRLVSDDPTRHGELGVVDPRGGETLADDDEFGRRITLLDAQGEAIVDLVIGDQVPAGGANLRFVREAGAREVYTAEVEADPSTAFVDWVERDLLKVEAGKVRELDIDPHRVDETRMAVMPAEKTLLARRERGDDDWTTEPAPEEGMEVADAKIDAITRALGRVRVSGVRALDRGDIRELMRYGIFFVPKTGTFYGNEGATGFVTAEGMSYRCYFGEIAAGTGHALSAGKEGEDGGATGKDHRFLVVSSMYRPERDAEIRELDALIAAKEAPAADEGEEGAGSEDPATGGDGDERSLEELREERARRVAEMEARQKRLARRFERFVFVIADSVFHDLRPDIDSLFKEIEAESEEGGPGGGSPGRPPGLPPRPPGGPGGE